MQGWQTPYLGQREIPREFSQFELQAFFTFSASEHELIARRRGDSLKLGLALHVGFVRMSGRPLNSVRVVPASLLAHLGRELDIAAPELASVRALYARGRTLFDHQQQACECLGFGWMTEHQRRARVRVLRDEVAQCADRERLLTPARQWLYDHKLLVLRDRVIRALVAAALIELERETAASIRASVPASTLKRWTSALDTPRPDGQACESWLWSAPAKHPTRQITEVLERIAYLTELGIDRSLGEINNVLVRRYARRLSARSPSRQLLQELADLAAMDAVADAELRARLTEIIAAKRQQRAPSRASVIRLKLIDAVAPVRSLLVAISKLPWQASGEHPALDALDKLRAQYASGTKSLPADVAAPRLDAAWREAIADVDRERAFRALEVATLFALRRALRNGSVWIEHSLSFRGRERLFLPDDRWKIEARRHYARLQLPAKAGDFLAPLFARVRAGVDAMAAAAGAGTLRADDELHLSPLAADEEDPAVAKLRARLNQRIGEVQLPEVILAVDAQVRFSWIMLGRETPIRSRASDGLCRHPGPRHQPDGDRVRAHDSAVVGTEHPPSHALGWRRTASGLGLPGGAGVHAASRHRGHLGPRRSGLVRHDELGDQQASLAGQAGPASADRLHRHLQPCGRALGDLPRPSDRAQRAPGRRGHRRRRTAREDRDDAAGRGHLRLHRLRNGTVASVGLRSVPTRRELNQRHVFVSRGMKVPQEIASVCQASINTALIESHWDTLVHLAASVRTGHASAVAALARFGSAARGDPIYDAGVELGKLLRTVFLADYFVSASFRRELHRVLNRGEAVNALKRAIYIGRVAPTQARRAAEMQAVADALSLLANVVMAWNTMQMHAVLDRWSNRRQVVPPELLGRIAPTRLEGINLRGVFRFPLERYAGQLMPSQAAAKTSANG